MSITVVIPAYNEEKRLGNTLEEAIKFLRKNFTDYEIIVVDDFSYDKTSFVASKYKKQGCRVLRNERNRGKGYSVRRGFLEAKKENVLFMDSDLATPIGELTKFMNHIKDFDIVIASRNMKESDIRVIQPKFRQFLGKVFPLVIRIFVVRGFKDTQCGFKLFRTKVAKKIASLQTLDGFAFDVEILYVAKKKGFRVKEVPVTWIDKKGSTVSAVRDGIKMLKDSFGILKKDLAGKYRE
ncbi:MAG: glycosyltransferase family 2 protein [Candidatus Aenigmarchaeota archaeon]|nr:glycosyltransferase family 2 protein [Candidatus Aenigmarchaeota archaeon]